MVGAGTGEVTDDLHPTRTYFSNFETRGWLVYNDGVSTEKIFVGELRYRWSLTGNSSLGKTGITPAE